MPVLVAPRDRTIWRIQDKAALKDWARGLDVPWKLRENLSQLLGFDQSGSSGVRAGHGREGYYLLHETSWMFNHKQRLVVPLFGSGPQKYKQLQSQCSVTFKERTLQNMVATPGKVVDGWQIGAEPFIVATLPDGSSLTALTFDQCVPTSAREAPACLPDYVDGLPGAQIDEMSQGPISGLGGSLETSQVRFSI